MRRLLLPVALLAFFALCVGGWIGQRGLAARDELTAAASSLATARSALLAQDSDGAAQAVRAARTHTRRAVRLTGDPIFGAVAAVPVAGRSIRIVRSVARVADELAGGVLPEAIETASRLQPGRLRRRDGSFDVALLAQEAPAVRDIAARVARLQGTIERLPTADVLGPIDRGRATLVRQLTQLSVLLSGASRTLALAPALLGADRPRTYFVLVQQTSESRGTGGLPGAYAIVSARAGRLSVLSQGSNADLKDGSVPVPPGVPSDFVTLYKENGAFDIWRNVNLSPDLPTVARVVAARWKQQSGQAVDGVITLDALALADILRGGPPIHVGGSSVMPAQLPDYLALGQYRDFAPLGQQAARKEKLAAVAEAATSRLTSGEGSTLSLVRGLVDAVRSGHMRMTSDDPGLGPILHASRVDGALPEGSGPVAYPVVFNSSGGKLDYFLDRTIRYVAGPCARRRRPSRIIVELTNRAPASGLPPYVTISTNAGRTETSYDNAVTLSIYATPGAQFVGATLDGKAIAQAPLVPGGTHLSVGTERGLPVWYVFLDLPRGQPRRLVLDLDEPVVKGPAQIPVQPLARPLATSVAVPECR